MGYSREWEYTIPLDAEKTDSERNKSWENIKDFYSSHIDRIQREINKLEESGAISYPLTFTDVVSGKVVEMVFMERGYQIKQDWFGGGESSSILPWDKPPSKYTFTISWHGYKYKERNYNSALDTVNSKEKTKSDCDRSWEVVKSVHAKRTDEIQLEIDKNFKQGEVACEVELDSDIDFMVQQKIFTERGYVCQQTTNWMNAWYYGKYLLRIAVIYVPQSLQ